jgi:uncharacterized protein (TIGR03437 family)
MNRTIAIFILTGVELAAQGFSCRRVETPPLTIRAGGLSELLPDILLSCTGGTPVAAGSAVPKFEILAISNGPLGNRIVPPPKLPEEPNLFAPPPPVLLWNDALLIVDDPPPASQRPCVPAEDADSCAATGATAPNVFQGKQLQSNVVVFRQIPINPPGAGRTRLIRIANLRADVSKLPATRALVQIQLAAQIFDSRGGSVPLQFEERVDAEARPAFKFEVRTSGDGAVTAPNPALTVTPAMVPQNNPGPATAINLKFTEQFAGAFRRRNLGTSGNGPTFVVDQANPGIVAGTESGFFNSAFPVRNQLNVAGLADSGTRLKVVITDIPDNVQIWVSGRDVSPGTSNYSERAPRALLTYTDANGSGPFAQTFSSVGGYSLVFPIQGTVTAVWEVVAADPDQVEELSFSIRLLAPNGVAHLGVAQAHGTIGPVFTGVPLPGASPDAPLIPSIPSFTPPLLDEPIPAFRVVPVINQASLTAVSAASYLGEAVAPDSVVAAFASGITPTTEVAGLAPAPTLAGVNVDVIDFTGTSRPAPLFVVSPGQINFLLDAATKPGPAVVNVSRAGQNLAVGYLRVDPVAPGLFSARGDGRGVAAGEAIYSDGVTSSLARFDAAAGLWIAEPVAVNRTARAFLSLRGTGIRGRTSLTNVRLSVGGEVIPVESAGRLDGAPGVDQVRAGPLPASLAGRGEVPVILTVDGKIANELKVTIQ